MGYSDWSDAAYQSRQGQRKATRKQTAFLPISRYVQWRGPGAPGYEPARHHAREPRQRTPSLAMVAFDCDRLDGQRAACASDQAGRTDARADPEGYVASQVLFGAVGDAYCDLVPLPDRPV
ncbi:MAG: hypothetical protein U0Z44_11805 [Kouleothrix sp.]